MKLSTEYYVPPYYIAMINNGLGERDEAIAWLERGYEQRDPRMAFLKVEPKWNDLRRTSLSRLAVASRIQAMSFFKPNA